MLAAVFFFAEYVVRVSPSVMVPNLMHAFDIDALGLGTLSAYFYFAYVGAQLPVGALIDRFGPRKALMITTALCGAGCILFSLTHTIAAANLARFLIGLGGAFAFVGTLYLASTWFPLHRFGFFVGATQAFGMLGAAVGQGPAAIVIMQIGWRHATLLMGLFLIILAVLIGLIVRDRPNHMPPPPRQREIFAPLLKNLWSVVKRRQNWINGVVIGFLYAPSVVFAELWGVSYLKHVYHLQLDRAALAIGLIFIGWGVSSPIMGWVSDRIRSRKKVILFSIIMSGMVLSFALYMPGLPSWAVFFLMFIYGMSNAGVTICYAVACESNSLKVSGTAMSFANMAAIIIGTGLQPLVGWLISLNWHNIDYNNTQLYSANDYRFAMLALPICFIVSLIAWFFLKESMSSHTTRSVMEIELK